MTTQLHDAYSIPLEAIDVSDPQLYQDDTWYPYFERLRREAPVHWCRESRYGPYWSVCKYKDIMQVEVNHGIYSSEPGIAVEDQPKGLERPNFIRMDPPKHDEQRKVVSPIVAPANLNNMSDIIRQRCCRVLDSPGPLALASGLLFSGAVDASPSRCVRGRRAEPRSLCRLARSPISGPRPTAGQIATSCTAAAGHRGRCPPRARTAAR